MKIGKHLSIISIVIALIIIILKLQIDISYYNGIVKVFPDAQGNFTRSLVFMGLGHLIIFLVPIIISLILCFKGIKKKNSYRKLGLAINILAIIYIIIPVVAIITVMKSTM
jgi:hypothetical protein